jgi:hypothetical protein
MKVWIIITILSVFFVVCTAYAGTAILIGEKEAGLNKICIYDHMGSKYALTVKSYQVCPITIHVDDILERSYDGNE